MTEPNHKPEPASRPPDWLDDEGDEVPHWAELPRLEIGDQASASMVIRFPLVPAVPSPPSDPTPQEPPELLPTPPGMVVVNDDFAGLRRLSNSAHRRAPKPDSTPATPVAPPPTPPVIDAPASPPASQGLPIVYGIVLRNTTAETMHDVRIEHELPPGPRYLGADPPPKVQGRCLIWDLGSFEPGSKQRFKITIQPNHPDEVPDHATSVFYVHQCLHSRRRLLRPAVTAKLHLPEAAQAGERVALAIEVTNAGRGAADELRVLAPLPPGLTHTDGAIVQFARARLAPGEFERFEVEILVERGGEYTVPVHVFGNNKLLASAQASLRTEGLAGEPPTLASTEEHDLTDGATPEEAKFVAQPFVLFLLDNDCFAVSAVRVREVRRAQSPTLRPDGPDWLAGVVDVAGESVPLIDMRRRMGLRTDGQAARILLVGEAKKAALLVDRALGVRRLDTGPAGALANELTLAMTDHEGRRVTVLDLDRLLRAPELAKI